MAKALIIVLVLTAYVFIFANGATVITTPPEETKPFRTDRPIIGVLAQEQAFYLQMKYWKENYTSYISAAYVKDLEKAGARVVPIMIGKNHCYYEELMKKLNGVLFPGGATFFNQSNGYADAGQHIYEIATEMNDAGDYFPLFGTCLGFELLIVLAGGRKNDNRVRCFSYDNKKLDFHEENFLKSKLFQDISMHLAEILSNEDVTVNAHTYCITDKSLKELKLDREWLVTSHSTDSYGTVFISSIENQRYPYYGVQFHPEKVAFDWNHSKYYVHTTNAVKANRYFMDFFVSECKKNRHSFDNKPEEDKYLIYKYAPTYTGAINSAYTQCYFFEPRGNVTTTTTTTTTTTP